MLSIIVPAVEQWDEEKEEFVVSSEDCTLELEHSLVSLSKWESKWRKPFYSKGERTMEEIIDYIRFMTIKEPSNPDVYELLTSDNIKDISDYIENPMTATTFSKESSGKVSNEIITAEIIYYWMLSLNIDMSCENWHLNRLIALIRVCSIKNTPPKKMSKRELMSRNAALNAQRRQMLKSKG